jgi:ribonuclease D
MLATVKRLGEIAATVAAELEIGPEVLATRRELERLAAGRQDVSLLRGWRKSVIGSRLLTAL